MLFSVIIPTYKRNDYLTSCLECLEPGKQTLSSDLYEVIVTDDDIQARSLIDNKFPWVRWFAGPQKGPAANRNNGAEKALGRWLVFTDDDCIPDAQWLNGYAALIEAQPEVLAMEGRIVSDREPKRFNESAPLNSNGGCFWSCNIAVRKDIFFEAGAFDDRFPYACMEDVALREVLKRRKINILFSSEAVVVHPLKLEDFSYVRGYIFKKQESILIFKKLYPGLAAYIRPRYFIRAAAFRIYYSLKSLVTFRCRGYWIVLYQSYQDVIFSVKLFR